MAKGRKTGGRLPGSPNRVTAALKDMILEALTQAGGVEYLALQATENPQAFLSLLGRVLPMQMNLSGEIKMPNVRYRELSGAETIDLATLFKTPPVPPTVQ